MLKKLMSFLFEEEEEEVYADGELEEAIYKDVPKRNAPEPVVTKAKSEGRPVVKTQSVSKPVSTPHATSVSDIDSSKKEPKKFTSIDLQPKQEVLSKVQQNSKRKQIIADTPIRNEKLKNEFNFAPIISPIFGSNDENNSSPTEAKVAATGSVKQKKSIDIISPMYGISNTESVVKVNLKSNEGKRHAMIPDKVLEPIMETREIPNLPLADLIKKEEEIEDDSMQISLFGEDAPIREDDASDYKIEE